MRAGNVIGGADWAASRIVPDCVRAWQQDKAVEIRHPESTRPWQHVLEPLSGYLRCAQMLAQGNGKYNGEAYNFGPNADQSHTVKELLDRISKYWEFKNLKNYFIVHANHSFHEAGLLKLNCDKSLHDLQWKPVLNFEQTALYTSTWYSSYYREGKSDMFYFTVNQIDDFIEKAAEKGLAWAQ